MHPVASLRHSGFRVMAAASCMAVGTAAAEPAAVTNLDGVVVTAAGYEQPLQQAPASITVIEGDTLRQRDVQSLADALRGIEGVDVTGLDARDGKTGNQSISLRGLPRDYTLVLIDGVRQNPRANVTPNSFNDSQSVFIPPVAAIDRIEVIRGPMSSLYGSDALGGVVNIITRMPGERWKGSASIGRVFQGDGDFGDVSTLDAYLAGPVAGELLSAQLHARVYDRERSDIAIPGVERPRPITSDTPTMGQNPVAAENYTVGGRLLLTPSDRHAIGLRLNLTRQDYDNSRGDIGALSRTGNPASSACNAIPAPNLCRGYDTTLSFDRDQATLDYTGRFDLGTWRTQVTRDVLETRGRTIPLGSGLAPAVEGTPRVLELSTNLLDSSFVLPLDRHTVTVGGQYIDPELTDGLAGGGTISVSQHSLFVEDEWRIGDAFTLTGGLRYDDNEAFRGEWTPRLYGVWQASAQWTVKGGVGRGFRAPNVEQLTDGIIGFGNQGTVPIFGNPGLSPEKSTNVEASALFAGKRLSAQGTVFRTTVTDLIESGTGANSGRALNIGEARLQGLELAASFTLGDGLSVGGNYTYTDSEVTRTQLDTGNPAQLIASRLGDPLVSVPRHMANARLVWAPTVALSTFIEAEGRSSAFRPRNFHEPQNGGNAQGQVAPGVRDSREVLGDFRGYTLLNLGASYEFSQHLTVSGAIYNVLGREFQDYRAYARCGNAGCTNAAGSAVAFSNGYNTIQEPRRVWLSLTARF